MELRKKKKRREAAAAAVLEPAGPSRTVLEPEADGVHTHTNGTLWVPK